MANPAQVRERAQHLIALRESPSFPVFREILETKIRQQTRRFISVPDLTAQQLDYHRGVLNGLQVALDVIEKGPQEFERAMRLARLEEGEE